VCAGSRIGFYRESMMKTENIKSSGAVMVEYGIPGKMALIEYVLLRASVNCKSR